MWIIFAPKQENKFTLSEQIMGESLPDSLSEPGFLNEEYELKHLHPTHQNRTGCPKEQTGLLWKELDVLSTPNIFRWNSGVKQSHAQSTPLIVSPPKQLPLPLTRIGTERNLTSPICKYLNPQHIFTLKAERRKLDSKSLKCFFVGYCMTQNAYRFWDPAARKIKISRDVIFDEQTLHIPTPSSNNDDPLKTILFNPPIADVMEQVEVETTRPKSVLSEESLENVDMSSSPTLNQDAIQDTPLVEQVTINPDTFTVLSQTASAKTTSIFEPAYVRVSPYPLRTRVPRKLWDESMQVTELREPYEPGSLADALSSPDAFLWNRAAKEVYDSLISNQT